nr:HNH endonuclease [Burkholderia vietnamiensis]
MEYVSCKDLFHQTGWAHRDIALLDRLDDLSDEDIQSVRNGPRRLLIKTIRQKYRAKDFSRRVLGAYLHRCAFCGVQLKLLDAAHIVPVAAPDSTDEVTNGVALCKLHHFAYDSNLVAFDTEYRIQISNRRVHDLQEEGLDGGLENFVRSLQPSLVLPEFRRHHPDRDCIERALEYRGWEI